jgi:hypothetical protein
MAAAELTRWPESGLEPSACCTNRRRPRQRQRLELRGAAITKKASDSASAAAPKIQHSMGTCKIHAHVIHVLSYRVYATFTDPEEFIHRK